MTKSSRTHHCPSRIPAVTERLRRIGYAVGTAIFCLLSGTSVFAEPSRFTFGLSAVTDQYLGQRQDLGFSEGYEILTEVQGAWGPAEYTMKVTLAGTNDVDGQVRLDGTELSLGNDLWSVALGATERNWSLSPNTSLIWSQNARPVPALSIQRQESPSEYQWLGWLGKWSGELVFGQLDAKQPDPNVSIFGARLVAEPLPGFEVELVRTAQWGGDGRPDGFDAFWNMLIGNSNEGREDNTDPANQLAGVGLAYTFPDDVVPLRLYMQVIGEDEAGGLPSCVMYLAGSEWKGVVGSVPTTVVVEGINTIIELTDGGFCGPNTAYQGQYSRGYSHLGSVMGATIDTAGQSLSIDVDHEFGRDVLSWGLSQVLINDTSLETHRLSSERVEGTTAYVSYKRSFGQGNLSTRIGYQDFDLDNAAINDGLNASVTYEFTY